MGSSSPHSPRRLGWLVGVSAIAAGAAADWVRAQVQPPAQLAFDLNQQGPAASSQPRGLFDHHGQLYFTADDGLHGHELWRYDGTTPHLVADVTPGPRGSVIENFASFGSKVLFVEATDLTRRSLWITDGTTVGTQRLLVGVVGPSVARLPWIHEVGDVALFVAGDLQTGDELWVTDGTPSGTRLLLETRPGDGTLEPRDLTPFRGGLVFRTGTDGGLWWSDGTLAGTRRLALPTRLSTAPVPYRDRLYFRGGGLNSGELWSSDLTPAGTAELADIDPGGNGNPSQLLPTAGRLYFVADDGVHGDELWSTDGTTAGTAMVADLTPGSASSTIQPLRAFGDRLLFGLSRDLHITDPSGTTATAVGSGRLGRALDAVLVTSPSRAYYPGFDTNFVEEEPWTTDGTTAGTFEHTQIVPGPGGSGADQFTLVGSRVYFAADDGVHGREIWTLDPGASVQTAGAPCGVGESRLRTSAATLGRPIRVDLWSSVGSMATLYLGAPRLPLRLSGGCSLFLEPGSIAVVGTFALAANGTWALSVPVPRDNALLGLHLALQAEIGPSPSITGVEVSPVARFTIHN